MSGLSKIALLIVVLEIGIGGYLSLTLSKTYAAPVPALSVVDPNTAAALQKMAAECKTAEDWHTLANTYMSAGFFAEASACYQQTHRLKPDWGEAIFNHGFCLSRFGQTSTANEKFQRVVDLKHERLADAIFFMGQNHLRDENPDLAEEAFRLAASDLPMAKYELARILFRKSDFDEAEAMLVDVLTDFPQASRVKLLLAEIAVAKQNQNRATNFRVDGTEITERLPTPFVTEKNRLGSTIGSYGFEKDIRSALQLLAHNRMDSAKAELQRLQEIQWSPNIHSALVDIAIQQNLFDDAVKLIEEEIELSGPTTLWLSRLGNVRMMAGNMPGAVEAWKLGVEIRNDMSVEKCLVALFRHYEQEGEVEEAKKFQFQLQIETARRAIKEGDAQKAIDEMGQAIVSFPDSAEAHYLLGKGHRLNLEHQLAAAAFEKCLMLMPNHGRAIRELEIVQ